MILYSPFIKRGITLIPSLILIPQWARYDPAYLAHEQAHAAQQREIGVLRFWWRYLTDRAFRQASEVEAYRVQIAHGAKRHACARYLTENYRLGIDYATAYALLKDYNGN